MKYQRVLLKLSGESLMGDQQSGICSERLSQYVAEIAALQETGVQIGIVIGGGNIFRGLSGVSDGFDRTTGDQMGMLATTINSLALRSGLEIAGVKSRLFTATEMNAVGERFHAKSAIRAMQSGFVVILSGGTGNPYFSTDTASALRALETQCDVFLKGTRVDGVYSSDPEKDPNAIKYEKISFADAYEKQLKIMDMTAFTLCQENNLPVVVFDMNTPGNLKAVISDENVGTLIKNNIN
ncbi:MAG: UMP kinase [Bacteroidota bacterium]|nr:UMP kinase [Bacteroidota bacterium]